jgi:hypothetical protein
MDDRKGDDATIVDIFAKDDDDDHAIPDYVSPVDFGHDEDEKKGDEIRSSCATILADPGKRTQRICRVHRDGGSDGVVCG